jgi:hypothetical protein
MTKKKQSTEAAVRVIRRRTRRKFAFGTAFTLAGAEYSAPS